MSINQTSNQNRWSKQLRKEHKTRGYKPSTEPSEVNIKKLMLKSLAGVPYTVEY